MEAEKQLRGGMHFHFSLGQVYSLRQYAFRFRRQSRISSVKKIDLRETRANVFNALESTKSYLPEADRGGTGLWRLNDSKSRARSSRDYPSSKLGRFKTVVGTSLQKLRGFYFIFFPKISIQCILVAFDDVMVRLQGSFARP